MRAIAIILVVQMVLVFGSSVASARDWIVTRISGEAWLHEKGLRPQVLELQMQVPEGSQVETSSNGRVRLQSAKNVMMLTPDTVAEIKKKTLFRRRTTIVQTSGVIDFDIEHRRAPHFEVHTPYMAAVVKGTRFSVSVSNSATSLAVDEGLVGVTDTTSGQSADVGRGQSATASPTAGGLSTSSDVSPSAAIALHHSQVRHLALRKKRHRKHRQLAWA